MFWNNGINPDQWHNAIIIPNSKLNKNKFNLSHYQPISNSTQQKNRGKIVNKHLI